MYRMCVKRGDAEMTCRICGRRLKGTTSMQRGYGPVCYRKIMPKSNPIKGSNDTAPRTYSLLDDPNYQVPGQMELSEFIDM